MEGGTEEDMGVYVLAVVVVVGEEEQISELQQEFLPQGWLLQVGEVAHMLVVVQMVVTEGIHLVDQLHYP